MTVQTKHKFISSVPDGPDAGLVRPSNWNDTHNITGTTGFIPAFDAAGNITDATPIKVDWANNNRVEILKFNTTADDYTLTQITRRADYTGGTPGFVNTALVVTTTANSGTKNDEWNALFTMNNFGTTADGSQNLAFAARADKNGTGGTWCTNLFIVDHNPDPVSSSVGAEIDCYANGTDVNGARAVLQLSLGVGDIAGATAPTVSRGLFFAAQNGATGGTYTRAISFGAANYETLLGTEGVATVKDGIDFSGITCTGSVFKSNGVDINQNGTALFAAVGLNGATASTNNPLRIVAANTTSSIAVHIEAVATGQQSLIGFANTTSPTWVLGRDTDEAFLIYDERRPGYSFRMVSNGDMFLQQSGGNVYSGGALKSQSASGGIGYATGAGSTVTQLTARTSGVTINTACGAIVLCTAAGSATPDTFTVSNSVVAPTDLIVLNQKSGADKYHLLVTAVATASFDITNYTTGGTTTEQPVINFAVIKGVTA